MFLSLDGVDGVGKSTQVRLLAEWLTGRGLAVTTCRDPGSTPLGDRVREILLGAEFAIHRRAEMLLYMAARAQLVEEVIRPALAAGRIVLCDRFLLANVVYQGHAGGLELESIRRVGEVAVGGLLPDLTILLDMPAESAAARLARSLDRMESQGLDYLERVRQGYLREAALAPERIAVLSAARAAEDVQADIRRLVEQRLAAWGGGSAASPRGG